MIRQPPAHDGRAQPRHTYRAAWQNGDAWLRVKRLVVLVAGATMAVTAPAGAQWPQPSSLELFGKFDCRIATAPTCLCSQDSGGHEVVYERLLAAVAAYPLRAGGEADRQLVQSKWRRQCGLLEQADTTP